MTHGLQAHDVFASLSYPMAIVTTADGDEHSGCLVGFHTQCSIDPPRYLACISVKNHTAEVVASAGSAAVHFLAATDLELAELFGEATGDAVDKFSRCRWSSGPDGVPILAHGGTWVSGPIVERVLVGDHCAIVFDAVHGGGTRPTRQLQFSDVKAFQPGHPA